MPPRDVMNMPTRAPMPTPAPPPQPFPYPMPPGGEQIPAGGNLGVRTQQPPMVATPAAMPTAPITVDPLQYGVTSPYGAEDIRKEAAKANIGSQVKQAEEQLKTQQGQQKVATILQRMSDINDELKNLGGIVSESQSPVERAGAYAATTRLGQEARTVADPKTQALAEEYKKLQSALLPYYASAAGLGAKSLDSEGERKSILDSFGSPDSLYEANQRQLTNLGNLFNTKISSAANGKKLLRYNPQTGRIE